MAEFLVDPEDDFFPSSFDTLTSEDWHTHQNAWITGIGSLNSESVYFEEDVPLETIVSRLQQSDFQLFPESDQGYSPKFWMLHGWFHSLNPAGTFANTHPDVSIYAPEELGAHGGHDQDHHGHQGDSAPLITGTDEGEQLFGTDEDDRINGFDGDDLVFGGLGDDSIWGSHGNDLLKGDDDNSSEGGNDMVYGGPGNDLIYGYAGNDRLFGGTEDDIIVGGGGDDLLRGSLGYDILTGDEGADTFVLAPTEGTDIITDLELDLDTIVLYAGITTENISIDQIGSNTALNFNDETLAIISGIDASDLMAASDDVFLIA
ncbi:MAG: calcium-binding protein [Xenococcaceae cyanobacterium MO_188.B29]|nr:calcium-binding protein [Xenococcaceae cyanobacterium MO_188.B29]